MATYGRIQRPEAVLQRAEEFISVGKDNDALNALHDIIKDRRHKQWSQTHEQIMLRHLELCVKLRNAGTAKDALYQYKSLTQQVAVASLENVMKHLLKQAEQKADSAQKESIEKVEEIDDLDSQDAPEALLLSVVSGAVSQDRMDRTVLSPWLRFLWESYRNCLDLLRNNNLVEHLYHQIARQSFEFCIKYQRRNEFRKLCDLLRLHLSQLQKNINSHSTQRINLADSLAAMQETRLIQLDTAIKMELWQEAYKSTEDLHNLMQLCKEKDKRNIKPQSFVNYFDKLSLIFWKGGNLLFHSAALLQKFTIYKDMKKVFAGEEATEQATKVLLATMSISDDFDMSSILTKHLDLEDMHLGNVRVLSTLLRLPIAPTRKGILREVARLNIPEMAFGPVAQLYRLMELEFAPLEAARLIEVELEKIKAHERPEYTQYIDAIRAVVATKILKALTNIYDAMSIDRMVTIIPFFTRAELEHFLVDITKQRFLKAQVDHRENCVRFGPVDATLSDDVETEITDAKSYRGGYESIRVHLTRLYELLGVTAYEFDEDKLRSKAMERFQRNLQAYEYHKESDYERMLQRKKIIEHHKENNENLKQAKLQRQMAEAAKKDEERRSEELRRLKLEQEASKQQLRDAEQAAVKEKIRQETLKRFEQNPIYSQIIKEKSKEALQELDPERLVLEQRERMDTERREQAIKMLQQERKFDYFVRGFNMEEKQILKKMSEERRAKAPELFVECENRRIEQAKIDRERELNTFKHLDTAKSDAVDFIRSVVASHKDDIQKKKADFQKRLAYLREKKLQERRVQREKERRRQWEIERKEEKERQEQAAQAKRDAEREERNNAIQAARRGNRDREFDRNKEDLPESVAENDSNWRANAAPRPSAPPARANPLPVRPPAAAPVAAAAAAPLPARRVVREREIERIKEEVPESVAESDINWRANAAAPVRSSAAAPPPRRIVREREFERNKESAPDSVAETDGNWRGNAAPSRSNTNNNRISAAPARTTAPPIRRINRDRDERSKEDGSAAASENNWRR